MVIIKRKKYDLCKINFDWLVDIINDETDNFTEFWLSHNGYGIKLFMFGIPTEEIEEIDEAVDNLERLILLYKQEYKLRFIDNVVTIQEDEECISKEEQA